MVVLKPCKNCGSTSAYMMQRIKGMYLFEVNCDGTPGDNSDLLDFLEYKDVWKKYRCKSCAKIMEVDRK